MWQATRVKRFNLLFDVIFHTPDRWLFIIKQKVRGATITVVREEKTRFGI